MTDDRKIEQLRTPPQSAEAEQAVLGALLLAPESYIRISDALLESDFYQRTHQLIYRAIREMVESGSTCDAITVGDWFASQGMSEQVANGAYIVELASTTPSAANIAAYAGIVKEHALKRALIEAGTEIVNRGFNCAASADTTDFAVTKMLEISSRIAAAQQDPVDLFMDAPFVKFDREWLPPGLAAYAWDQAEIMGMPPEMLAMGCLGAICAAMSDNFVLKVKRNENWCERSRLWIMVISQPGAMKSTALNRPMAALNRIEAKMMVGYSAKNAEYAAETRVFNVMSAAAIKRKAKGEGHEDLPKPPVKPPQTRIKIENVTTEMLGELLTDNPRGLHWFTDEVSTWFGAHDAYSHGKGGVDRGYALKAYDGGPTSVDRIGRGSIHIPNWSYSLMGATQPDKIKEMTAKMTDDGLLQRFITIEIPEQLLFGNNERPENIEYTKKWDECIETMWHWGTDGKGGTLTLDDEAEAIRADFERWVIEVSASPGLPSMFRGHLSKWRGLFPRLLMCYHAFGCAHAKVHIMSQPISGRTASRVLSFMKKFLLPNAMKFYGTTMAASDPTYSLVKRVGEIILARGLRRVTNRDLQQGILAWRDAPDWRKRSAISMMQESGWLVSDDEKRTASADSGWIVVEAVHRKYAERAVKAKASREQTAKAMRMMSKAMATDESAHLPDE